MAHLAVEQRGTAVATFVSALVGSLLFVLLAFNWPRPIIDWMRVIVPPSVYPAPAELSLKVAVVFVFVALLLAVAVLGVRWLLQSLRVSRPATGVAVILAVAFALTFTAEAASQVVRAWGNLTASDATGLIIDDGRLTLHGWETIARRSVVASLYAGIMAAAFCVARLALRARGDHT